MSSSQFLVFGVAGILVSVLVFGVGYAFGFKEAKEEAEPTYSPEVVRLYNDIQTLIKKQRALPTAEETKDG